MARASSRKTERLEARVTRVQKRTIARAAELRGVSFTDFVVTATQEAALDVIKDSQTLALHGAAQEDFVNAILRPPKPAHALRAAAKRYRARIR